MLLWVEENLTLWTKMFWMDPIGYCLSPVESRISPTRHTWRGEVSYTCHWWFGRLWMLLSLALACFHSIITKCLFVFIPVASLCKQFMLEWKLSEASPVTRHFSHSCRESGVMTLEASGDWRAMKQSSTLFSKCHVMVTVIPQTKHLENVQLILPMHVSSLSSLSSAAPCSKI